jgi:prepilin-type processing-associated H-X9-DG protein
MQCGNNLKQLGIGLHNYHDVHKKFPVGWFWIKPPQVPNEREAWGWGAYLLPYIEQGPLHEQLGVSRRTLEQALASGLAFRPLFMTRLTVFQCPSDTGTNAGGLTHNNRRFDNPVGVGTGAGGHTAIAPVLAAASNYVGNAGHRSVNQNANNNGRNTGIFFADTTIGIGEITDGTSNTIMVGERETKECRSGTWIGMQDCNGNGTKGNWMVLAHAKPKINQDINVIAWNSATNDGCGEGFASRHPGGVQVALCDGSVRFLSDTINHFWYATSTNGTVDSPSDPSNGVFQRMMSRSDGLTFSLDN